MRQQRCQRRQRLLRERGQRQAWRARTPREEEREREKKSASRQAFAAVALSLSLCALSLGVHYALTECIFNMGGVSAAHFANWNVYKPGEQLPQYSLLFTFPSGLVSATESEREKENYI